MKEPGWKRRGCRRQHVQVFFRTARCPVCDLLKIPVTRVLIMIRAAIARIDEELESRG